MFYVLIVLYKIENMTYRAFIEDDDTPFRIEYYHNPKRWTENITDSNNPIMSVDNWSSELKYFKTDEDNISDEICNLPTNTGGIYMFYIKGICLPFVENYIVYIGRCKYTDSQNIRKRAKEYFTEDYQKGKRQMIQKMLKHWKNYLYYRYFSDTDNAKIDQNESFLIRTILPPFNEVIPDRIEIQTTVPAF